MDTIKLNLARKWRPQNFETIIGQDLSVRTLKNSLYLGQYFPVYLFAGQRGCGKTTMARVFAAAINCEQLSAFQKKPKKALMPCLRCSSCTAMQAAKHPDFIEIDAASHTGVDNVRQIIESSSLMPLMGHKKIYLIDEAHMLSKAAFNALLKILEEPPTSALFILATTNLLKVIDTVRSRCFQLFFSSIDLESLLQYLQQICQKESIEYHDDALTLIITQAEGSARDALNLLEQVRFSSKVVSRDAVLSLLGHIDDCQLIRMIETVLQGSPLEVLQLLQSLQCDRYSAELIWKRLTELLRALLWLKHGVNPSQFISGIDGLRDLVKQCSLQQLHDMLEMLYANEAIMLKTTTQHALLEMVLLQVCQSNKKPSGGSSSSSAAQQQVSVVGEQDDEQDDEDEDEQEYDDEQEEEKDEEVENKGYMEHGAQFIACLETSNDPLVISIFKQARIIRKQEPSDQLDVEFAKDLAFFKNWLEDTKQVWLPWLQKVYSKEVILNLLFTGIKKESTKIKSITVPQQKIRQPVIQSVQKISIERKKTAMYKANTWNKRASRVPQRAETVVDVSDEAVWKKANLLLRNFPGTVTETSERVYER